MSGFLTVLLVVALLAVSVDSAGLLQKLAPAGPTTKANVAMVTQRIPVPVRMHGPVRCVGVCGVDTDCDDRDECFDDDDCQMDEECYGMCPRNCRFRARFY